MSGDHSHDHAGPVLRAGARHAGRLRLAFGVLLAFFVAEAVGGVVTDSLALLSDAGHMLTDVLGLGMALAAIHLANRSEADGRGSRTFGLYRLEILAALANAVLLFGVAAYVVIEAISRLADPPEVPGLTVLGIASGGLAANLVAYGLLRRGAAESINVEGAYLEVLADTVGSLGVIIGAGVVALTGWGWVDPVVAVAIGLWILPRTWRLAGRALRILLEAAPSGVDLGRLSTDLAGLPGVVDVHDVHVWTLTSEMEAASAHLMVAVDTDNHAVLDQARVLLKEGYGLTHATLQVEPEDHAGCDEMTW
ncbi:MAG: cation transporter [Acidimicrobiia bacterium]|nr:cation transporter [Acidimicrobiia bacterium]